MKKFLLLFLKIFLIVFFIFSLLLCIALPKLIAPVISLFISIICLWELIKQKNSISQTAKIISKTRRHFKFYVTVEFVDGRRKTLKTNIQMYNKLLEYENGVVFYNESSEDACLLDFKKDGKSYNDVIDHINKYPKPGSPEMKKQLKIAGVISIFIIAIYVFVIIKIMQG